MYKALYGESSTHIAMRRCRSNGHNIHQSLERAVERDSQFRANKTSSTVCVAEQLVRPSIISHVDTSKKRNSNQFHGINSPPVFAFTPTVQSLDVGMLCKATMCALLLEGERLPLPLHWKLVVGGISSAPKIPIEKLRSDRSLPLPRISPTSITYAESYAHWTLVGADLFWSCRLMMCIWHNVTMMLFSPVAGK